MKSPDREREHDRTESAPAASIPVAPTPGAPTPAGPPPVMPARSHALQHTSLARRIAEHLRGRR